MLFAKSNDFRADMEALRGIAVTLVVLFHFKTTPFISGFIGVDVFFVLSGYLMASALCGAKQTTLTDFYERRARRILPASIAVVVVMFLISPILFLPFEAKNLLTPLIGTLALAPNIMFWRENDYFSELAFSPMLHYWSLGVELQYYALFPLLVKWLGRRQFYFLLIGITSLVASIAITKISSKTAFFFMPTRLWEFFAGYCAFHIYSQRLNSNRFQSKKTLVFSAFSTIALMGYAMLEIPQNAFPGWYSVPPVLLTAIVLSFGIDEASLARLPGLKFLRAVGKYSFSIYLIHMPVIFAFQYSPFSVWKPLGYIQIIAILLITAVLSFLLFHWVEIPFRNRTRINLVVFIKALVCAYAFSVGAAVLYSNIDFFAFVYKSRDQKIFAAFEDKGVWRCSKFQKMSEPFEESCYLLKNPYATRRVYLVGDSQMDALKEVFVSVYRSKDVEIRLNRERCFLGFNQCASEQIKLQVDRFGITDIVLHGWAYNEFDYVDLQRLVDWSRERGVKIHFIGPIPTYERSVPRALYEEYHGIGSGIARINRANYQNSIFSDFRTFQRKNSELTNIFFYDPSDYFCPDMCLLETDADILYFDSHHPTISGAKILSPMMDNIIAR